MKKQTKLSLLLLIIISAFAISLLFTSCNQPPQGSENGGFTSQSVPGLSAERISTTSTGDIVYIAQDAGDFQTALTQADNYPITEIKIGADELTGKFTFKGLLKCKAKQLEIHGGSINGSLTRVLPQNQKEAVDSAGNWYQYRFNVHDVAFTGSGSNGLSLNCTYGSRISNCTFNGKDTALIGIFCLKTVVENCLFTNSKYGGSIFMTGVNKWQGAGASTSASNHTYFVTNRVFNAPGALFGAAFIGASGTYINNYIGEGKSPVNHIIIDDQNSTTCWNDYMCNLHLESAATGAGILIKKRQGITEIVSPYPQYAMTLIDAQSYAGAVQVNVSDLCWIPSGSKFASTGNIRYRFKDLYNTVRADTSTMWVNAKFPNVLCQENLTASGLVVKNYVNGKRQ
jgi:hypothetical protein